MRWHFLPCVFVVANLPALVYADANVRVEELKSGGIAIFRPGGKDAMFEFRAPEDGRPYVHPMYAPDGSNIVTEMSPYHHKHQTGIYVGFLKVNGRDYFHNRGADHFRRQDFKFKNDSEGTRWTSTYELLDKDKKVLLTESQAWHFRDFTKTYLIDLTITLKANADVTFDKHEYGGLFIRMPWNGQKDARAINSEGDVNEAAEGKPARWIDVAMTVADPKDHRARAAHIAVMSREPVPWRVDGQFGVGPAPSRTGAWKLEKGQTKTLPYRFYVYMGAFQEEQVQAQSKAFSAIK
jgi:hypothetical protein